MSAHPVFAAAVGVAALGQTLAWTQWTGIGLIVAANTWSVLAAGGRTESTSGPMGGGPAADPGAAPAGDPRYPTSGAKDH